MRLLIADTEHAPVPEPWLRLGRVILELVEQVAFWLAVLLPLAYPFVLPDMAFPPRNLPALVGVIVLHASTLVVGQRHEPGH